MKPGLEGHVEFNGLHDVETWAETRPSRGATARRPLKYRILETEKRITVGI